MGEYHITFLLKGCISKSYVGCLNFLNLIFSLVMGNGSCHWMVTSKWELGLVLFPTYAYYELYKGAGNLCKKENNCDLKFFNALPT